MHMEESTATERPTPVNALFAYVGAFVDELWRAGVRNVVICPGSRSTPLAMAFAADGRPRVWMHVDERSAGFFALGMAKRVGKPVALVCTSGTAAANFFPAVVEAKMSHVPLLMLTADRPPELRENGAPQAIDQNRLYGTYAKWFAEAALPEATNGALRYIRTLACRAVAETQAAPAGPVHLNLPFREPLVPVPGPLPPEAERDPVAWYGRPNGAPYALVESVAAGEPSHDVLRTLATLLRAQPRGVIVVGPHVSAGASSAVSALAAATGYPVLADALSPLRASDGTIASYDAFLRSEAFVHTAEPQVIVRIGPMPTSKPFLQYLTGHGACSYVVIDGVGQWDDPTQLASVMVHADPASACAALARELGQQGVDHAGEREGWRALWRRADTTTRQALCSAMLRFEPPFEGRVFLELAEVLPEGATLFVGNSMPVRDADTFLWSAGKALRVLGNRGANGIDGVVSTALGVSAAGGRKEPVVLVLGDLSFYHDLNGLLAARLHGLDLTVILVNNDGGGIFSFLPQAQHPDSFERLFGTPTGLDFAPVVGMYGGVLSRPQNWDAFRADVRAGTEERGLRVIEVRTDRDTNVRMHRELWAAVDRALHENGVLQGAEAAR